LARGSGDLVVFSTREENQMATHRIWFVGLLVHLLIAAGCPVSGDDDTAPDDDDAGDDDVGDDDGTEDLDGDGFDAANDCDDSDPNVNPMATEVPYDGVDNDCDPETPDDDLDGDGFDSDEDCDDDDAAVNPDGEEIPYDGADNDCDPATLDDDLDGDGYDIADDCDDEDAAVNPGAVEIEGDGVDNDCDSSTLDGPDTEAPVVTSVQAEDCHNDMIYDDEIPLGCNDLEIHVAASDNAAVDRIIVDYSLGGNCTISSDSGTCPVSVASTPEGSAHHWDVTAYDTSENESATVRLTLYHW